MAHYRIEIYEADDVTTPVAVISSSRPLTALTTSVPERLPVAGCTRSVALDSSTEAFLRLPSNAQVN